MKIQGIIPALMRLICRFAGHLYHERPYVESLWSPHTTLHVCHRCGKLSWGCEK